MRSTILVFFFLCFILRPQAQIVGTFAGIRGQLGAVDGTPSEATFNNPHGIAISQSGNIYLSDRFNHIIRKISPEGIVTTIAGNSEMIGDADGYGSTALFYEPWGICVDGDENVFVADTRNNKIKKITPDGEVTTFAGTGNYGSTDGPTNNCTFGQPVGIEVDNDGNIYVSDHGTHTIRKIGVDGIVSTLAGTPYITGDNDGPGNMATFYKPYGLTIDLQGNILVADEWNHKIRRITPEGEVSTIAGTGTIGAENGSASNAAFNYPWDVAVDSLGNIYVADGLNMAIRKIIPDGDMEVVTLAGMIGASGSEDGMGEEASFNGATGVAFSPLTREVFVADAFNNLIRKITDVNQGVFVNLEAGITQVCPNETIAIRAYPNVFEEYHFYIDGTFLETSSTPTLDINGISPGIHHVKVIAELGAFQTTSDDFEFEIFPINSATINIVGNTTFFEGDSVIFIASFGSEYFWSNGSDEPSITVREAGDYSVEVIDQNGCSNFSESIEVIIRYDPDPIEINYSGLTTLCHGQQLVLESSQSGNVQWIKDGWPIIGAENSTFTVNESGVYQVQYLSEVGIIVVSEPLEINILPAVDLEFRSDRIVAKPNQTINFLLLNENLSSVEWNFGDPGSGINNIAVVANPSHEFAEYGTYDIRVNGKDENGCSNSVIKEDFIQISRNVDPDQNDDDIFIATAFTPNNDGENDILFVRGSDVSTLSFKIFNQRRKLLFESNSKNNGWDGLYKNENAPIGNYIFQISYTNLLGIKKELAGIVTLLR